MQASLLAEILIHTSIISIPYDLTKLSVSHIGKLNDQFVRIVSMPSQCNVLFTRVLRHLIKKLLL